MHVLVIGVHPLLFYSPVACMAGCRLDVLTVSSRGVYGMGVDVIAAYCVAILSVYVLHNKWGACVSVFSYGVFMYYIQMYARAPRVSVCLRVSG